MIKRAILLANLGSPLSYQVKDVKNYLNEFLMDERVIDIPHLLRFLLVKGIIVPFRAPKSAEKYKSIWKKDGSPLILITKELTQLVHRNTGLPTYMCMRYANPTPASALAQIHNENPEIEEIVLLPLYPHYAMSSYETAVEHVSKSHLEGLYRSSLLIVKPFYNHSGYINALSESIRQHLTKDYDHILFSYHGIPERHVKKTDITGTHCLKCENCCDISSAAHDFCYRHQIKKTTELVANKLQIPSGKFSFSFQSRLGRDQWLTPYTAGLLEQFPLQGIKKLVVVCPAFVSDCLETLEEIEIEGRASFMAAGGESFDLVPCLNFREDWVETISELIMETT